MAFKEPSFKDIYTNTALKLAFEKYNKDKTIAKEIEFGFDVLKLEKKWKRYLEARDKNKKASIFNEIQKDVAKTNWDKLPVDKYGDPMTIEYYKNINILMDMERSSFTFEPFAKLKEEIDKAIEKNEFKDFLLSREYKEYEKEEMKIGRNITENEKKLIAFSENTNKTLKSLLENLSQYLIDKAVQSNEPDILEKIKVKVAGNTFLGFLVSKDSQKYDNAVQLHEELTEILNSKSPSLTKIDDFLEKLNEYLEKQREAGGVRRRVGASEKSVREAIQELERLKENFENLYTKKTNDKLKPKR